MDTLLQDLRYAGRRLAAAPGFSLVVLLTLALGIGATTAIFSVVSGILLRPLPYAEPGRLVTVWQDHRAIGREEPEFFPPPDFFDWRDQNRTFERMTAFRGWSAALTGSGEPVRVRGWAVTDGFFEVLGVPMARGRAFLPEEDVANGPRVVVLSHGFWQRQFGGAADVIGRTVRLNDEPWMVVGVTPPGFRHPYGDADLFRPLQHDPAGGCQRGCWTLRAFGRLAPGVTLAQAQADVAAIAARIAEQYPETNAKTGAWLIPMQEQIVGNVRPALVALFGAVAFVLLIACVNIANLLLARAAAREREVSIRTALGAARWRVVRQLLTESIALALVGGTLGLLLASWAVDVLVTQIPETLTALYAIAIDARVVGFALAVSIAAAILFGLVPALQASRADLAVTMNQTGRGSSGGVAVGRIRNGLVVAELALALMLLAGAGLLVRSFLELTDVDPGFDPDRIVLASLSLPVSRYEHAESVRQFHLALEERLQRQPSIAAAAIGTETPLQGGDGDIGAWPVDRPDPGPNEIPSLWVRMVTPAYFRTLRMPIVAGRGFTEEDRQGAPLVTVLSRASAERYWPGEDPIGRQLRLPIGDTGMVATVVGLVEGVRHDGLEAPLKMEGYFPFEQLTRRSVTFVIRAAGNEEAVVPALRSELARLDPTLPLGTVETMAARMAGSLALPRLYMRLFTFFGAAALALAAIGIYGVIAYSVVQRTRELGIRMALGADRSAVLRLVAGHGGRLAVAGIVIGTLGALAIGRVLRSLLFGVSASDPVTLAGVAFLLAAIAITASWIPARRATRIDPTLAMRAE